MKNSMKLFGLLKATLVLSAILLAASASTANAQYQVTTLGVAVVENFDGLTVPDITAMTADNKLAFSGALGSTTQAQRNSAWSRPLLVNNSNGARGVGNDVGNTSQTGGFRAYGEGTSTDRALGYRGSGSGNNANTVATFDNATGATVTSFVLSFTGENWFRGTNARTLTVEYSINGGSFTGTGMTSFTSLSGTNANINGDASANRTTGLGGTITNISLSSGQNIQFRFLFEGGSTSSGFALDDISVTFNGGAAPVTSLSWLGGTGGTGTWNATNTNWGSPAQTWNASLTGIFGGTAGTVTIDTPEIFANAGLIFGTTGYEITGAALTLGGGNATANTITTNASVTSTISSSVAGSAGFTKAGTGTLILNANNTISGDAIISAGNLTLAAAGALGSVGNVTVGTGTTLFLSGAAGDRINNSAAVSVAGTFNLNGLSETIGALSLTAGTVNTGVGILTLGGNVTVNSGTTATVSGNLNLGGANRVITVANGSSATDLNLGATVISNGGLTFNGSAAGARTDLSGVSIYAGGTTLNSGTLNFEASSTGAPGAVTSGPIGTGSFVINGGLIGANFGTRTINNTVTVSGDFGTGALGSLLVLGGDVGLGGATRTITVNDNPLSITGAISNGALTKAGTGNLTLSGVNIYTGNTTVSSGNLILGASNVIANGSNLTVAGGNFVMGANSDTVNAVTVTSGNITGSGATLTGTSFAVTNTTGTVNVSAGLAGASANLTKSGAGTLVLSGSNSYGGGTTVGSGIVLAGSDTAFGSGNISVSGTATLASADGTARTFGAGNNISLGSATTFGQTSVGTGSLTFNGSVDLGGAANRSVVTDVNTTFNGVISNGGLTKSGAGNLTLGGTNIYTGNTTVNSGNLILGASTVIANGSNLTIAGGNFVMGANSDTVNLVTVSSGNITGSSATLTANSFNVTNTSGTVNISAGLAGSSANLTKSGGGTLVLSGASTYGGNTTISQGTLQLGASNVLPTGTIVQVGTSGANSNRGLLDINGNSQTIAGLILLGGNTSASNSGNVTIGSGGVLTVNGSITYETGSLNRYPSGISGGTLDLGGASRDFIVFDNNNPSGGDLIITSEITNGGINKLQTGILSLNVANTHSGNTTVNAGTVRLGHVNAVQNSTLDTGTAGSQNVTFTVAGTNTYNVGGLAGSDDLAIGGNTISVGSNGANTTFSGNISGTGALVKVGSGTLSLAAVSSYSGGTTINGGVLQVDGPNRLGAASGALTINTGTLQVSGVGVSSGRNIVLGNATSTILVDSSVSYNATSAAVISGAGTLNKSGAGLLTLNGNNTYSGATVVQAGTVRFTTSNTSATAVQALGTNATVNLGVAATSSGTLEYTGTGAATLAKDINALGNGNDAIVNSSASLLTLTGAISKNGTFLTLKGGSGGLSVNGSITGSASGSDLIVDGGTVNLNAANTYNGPTLITGNGTLNANVANAMGNTTLVTINSGANLVISVNGTVSDASPVVLNGGTITRGAGVSETFGGLTLTANSTLDFGTGAIGSLNFGGYGGAANQLIVLNFAVGNVLTFKTDLSSTIGNTSLFSFSNAFSSGWDSGSSTFTITAIPEPTVILPILAFIGLFLWGERKRIPNQIRKRLRKLGLARN